MTKKGLNNLTSRSENDHQRHFYGSPSIRKLSAKFHPYTYTTVKLWLQFQLPSFHYVNSLYFFPSSYQVLWYYFQYQKTKPFFCGYIEDIVFSRGFTKNTTKVALKEHDFSQNKQEINICNSQEIRFFIQVKGLLKKTGWTSLQIFPEGLNRKRYKNQNYPNLKLQRPQMPKVKMVYGWLLREELILSKICILRSTSWKEKRWYSSKMTFATSLWKRNWCEEKRR